MTKNFEDLATLRLLDEVRARLASAIEAADDEAPSLGEVPEGHDATRSVEPHLAALHAAGRGLAAFDTSSRLPGGALLHRVVGSSVRRDTALLSDRLDAVRDTSVAALSALAAHVDRSVDAIATVRDQDRASIERTLGQVLARQRALEDALIEIARRSDERSDRLERRQREAESAAQATVQAALVDVRASIEHLAAGTEAVDRWIRDHEFHPWFSNVEFADAFRGSRDDILLRYADVADLLVEHGGTVVDLGCGRGELIELVMSKGGRARGVEYDPELVKHCRDIFLDVEEGTAHDGLGREPDASLGGIALIQVVEHLTPQQLVELVPLAYAKLAPGGVLAMETVNAVSPFVFTRSFYLDPTHTNPVHHEYLAFLCRQAGFEPVDVQWRSPVPAEEKIPLLDGAGDRGDGGEGGGDGPEARAVEQINERITALNQFLFSPQDYLVVARKPRRPTTAHGESTERGHGCAPGYAE